MLTLLRDAVVAAANSGRSTWWHRRPERVRVLLVAGVVPGLILHELAHAVVAARWANVEVVDADDSVGVAVDMTWRSTAPAAATAYAYLAPLVTGWLASWVLAAAALVLPTSSPVVVLGLGYGAGQLLLYTLPGLVDVYALTRLP